MQTPAYINNEIYNELGDRWYIAQDDPVALLRAESELRNSWIREVIRERIPVNGEPPRVLDIGCGAGFLSNALSATGCSVDGIDQSEESLRVARKFDVSGKARYRHGDAYTLPYESDSFDVVCAMDFLEHVSEPGRVIAESARVLRENGVFFFHTFSRNPLAGLVVIKGVEWFVRNTPPALHRYSLFIRPGELRRMCLDSDLDVEMLRGCRPVVGSAFFKLLWTRVVPENFRFRWTSSTLISYTGFALKRADSVLNT